MEETVLKGYLVKTWIKDKLADIKDDLKRIHKSVTIWLIAVVGLLSEAVPQITAFMPDLQPYLPEPNYQVLMRVLLIGGFVLRFKTTKALRDK